MSSETQSNPPSSTSQSLSSPALPRTIAYIDGFNLYFGLREEGWSKYYWLDLPLFAATLAGAGKSLVVTKYFTSRISGSRPGQPASVAQAANAKQSRQSKYLKLLASRPDLEIQYGTFLGTPAECFHCKKTWVDDQEKMTDVNIATAMLTDAFQDKFDVAILVSGDSDLVPPIRAIKEHCPGKQVLVFFPPRRSSKELMKTADDSFQIFEAVLKKTQFPDRVTVGGYDFVRPGSWK